VVDWALQKVVGENVWKDFGVIVKSLLSQVATPLRVIKLMIGGSEEVLFDLAMRQQLKIQRKRGV